MLFLLAVLWRRGGLKIGVGCKKCATFQTFKEIQQSKTICFRDIIPTLQTPNSADLSL